MPVSPIAWRHYARNNDNFAPIGLSSCGPVNEIPLDRNKMEKQQMHFFGFLIAGSIAGLAETITKGKVAGLIINV